MRRVVSLIITLAWVVFVSCSDAGMGGGRAPVEGREVSKHDHVTIYEERLELTGGVVTCVLAEGSGYDVSISCDWPS